ncbi:MAG: hypothetical protein AMXMBFR33_70590 [Candidatus Xenobia bacterium]
MKEFVYSTDENWCPKCQKTPCACAARKTPSKPSSGPAKMRLEKSGRGGKAVTVLFELPLDEAGLKELLKTLKTRCGTGGALKGQTLEIQGDHREAIEKLLGERGIKVKRAGG